MAQPVVAAGSQPPEHDEQRAASAVTLAAAAVLWSPECRPQHVSRPRPQRQQRRQQVVQRGHDPVGALAEPLTLEATRCASAAYL